MAPPEPSTGLIVLLVGLLVGGLAIHVGSIFALASRDYTHAVVTAAIGAVAWALVEWLFVAFEVEDSALVGLVAAVVWVYVIKLRYDTGWLRAGIIGLIAWLAAVVVLSILASFDVTGLSAYGVPGP